MKTIKFKKIDEYKIFSNFDQLPTDTAASMINADELVKDIPEYKERQAKAKQKEDHLRKAMEAKGRAKLASIGVDDADKSGDKILSKKLKAEFFKSDKEYRGRIGAAGVCDEELKEIETRLRPKSLDVRRANLVYSEARRNEIICTQEQISAIAVAVSEKNDNQQISLEVIDQNEDEKNVKWELSGHSFIDDFRGCQYFFKDSAGNWVESVVIAQLGVDKNSVVDDPYQDQAVEKKELTVDELEEIRLQCMTSEEKVAEYEVKKAGLANQAAAMENELKFDGDADFLSKAQAWYDAELLKLKLIYEIS